MWFDHFRSSPVQEKTEDHPVIVHHNPENYQFKAPVSFTNEETRQDGQCLSISDSGLLAVFEHPQEPWTEGQLVITVLDKPIRIPARVARVNGHEVGFHFHIDNEEDLASITALIAWISNPEGTPPVEASNTQNAGSDQATLVPEVAKAGQQERPAGSA